MKTKLLALPVFTALALFASEVSAQRYQAEVFSNVTVTTDVQYASNISVLSGTPAMVNLNMDIYEPTGDTATQRPLIIFMHTGSYLPAYINGTPTGSRNDNATVEMCKQFAKRGYVVANMDYRLGWNPVSASLDVRRGTLLQAVYRSIQDAKACVRWHRSEAAGANTYKIDPNLIILGGQGTGGYIALNYASLDKPSEINLPKFISGITVPGLYIAGQSYVLQDTLGDFDGYGGVPWWNNPNNTPGFPTNVQFVFNLGGAMGDSTWLEAGDAPMVALHVIGDPFAPYDSGIVYVPGTPPQAVVDVAGSRRVLKIANQLGNNNCFANNGFTDPYTQTANLSNEGFEGLFPFPTVPAVQAGPWEWIDSATVYNVAPLYGQNPTNIYYGFLQTNPANDSTRALAYIDTIMGYVNPRMCYCLGFCPPWSPTGLNPNADLASLVSVGPNPSAGNVDINLDQIGQSVQSIELTDVSGRVIMQFAIDTRKRYTIQHENLNAGIYFVRLRFDSGEVNKKIILE